MGKRTWSKEKEDYLKNNYFSADLDRLAKHFAVSIHAIHLKASRMGLKRKGKDWWTNEDINYLKKHYKHTDLKEISIKLNRTNSAIFQKANRLKLKRGRRIGSCIKYAINNNFFKEWNNEMAYVLGLFCADGNLSKFPYRFSIFLHKSDSYLLQKILDSMKSSHKLFYQENKNMSGIAIGNETMYKDLLALNIPPAKSRILKCPKIPKKFIPKFILEELDGDGSIHTKRKDLQIMTSSKDFSTGISNLLSEINIHHTVYSSKYKCGDDIRDLFHICVNKRKDVYNLCNMMYKDTDLFLVRKRKQFEEIGAFDISFVRTREQPVIGINIETSEEIKFSSILKTADAGFYASSVGRCCRGGRKSHKGYIWKYNKGERYERVRKIKSKLSRLRKTANTR